MTQEQDPLRLVTPSFSFRLSHTSINGDIDTERHENRISRIVSEVDHDDAKRQYDIEAKDNQNSLPTSSTVSIFGSRKQVVQWEDNDPENPYNWSSVCHYPVPKEFLGKFS